MSGGLPAVSKPTAVSDEPVDMMGPWTIKAVPTEIRNKVTAAARKEGLTVGQWLERRVNEWLDDGGPVQLVPVAGSGNGLDQRAAPPPSLDPQSLMGAAVTLKELDALEPQTTAALNSMIRRMSKAKP